MFENISVDYIRQCASSLGALMNGALWSRQQSLDVIDEERRKDFERRGIPKADQAKILGIHPRTIYKHNSVNPTCEIYSGYSLLEILVVNATKVQSFKSIKSLFNSYKIGLSHEKVIALMKSAINEGYFTRKGRSFTESTFKYTGKTVEMQYLNAKDKAQTLMSSPHKRGEVFRKALTPQGYKWLRQKLDVSGNSYLILDSLTKLDQQSSPKSFSYSVAVILSPETMPNTSHAFAPAANALLSYNPLLPDVSFVRPTTASFDKDAICSFKTHHVPEIIVPWLNSLLQEAAAIKGDGQEPVIFNLTFVHGTI